MSNDNTEYTEQVLPLIVKNFNLKNPDARFIHITDFITRLEFAVRENEDVASQVLYTYSLIHFN